MTHTPQKFTHRTLAATALLLCLCSAALARPLSVRVEKVLGPVTATVGKASRRVVGGQKLVEGDKVATGKAGTAILVWETGHVLKLGPLTTMILKSASQTARKETTKVRLETGSVFVRAARLQAAGSVLHIESADLVAGVRGTSFNVSKPLKGPSIVAVLRGQVSVGAAGLERLVSAGMMSSAVKGQKPTPAKPAPAAVLQQMQGDDTEAGAIQSSSLQAPNSDAAEAVRDNAVDAIDQQIENSILNQINEPGNGSIKFEVK